MKNSIFSMAAVIGVCIAIGVALGVMGFGVHGQATHGPMGTDPTSAFLILMFVIWMITTLMIGQALPSRRRSAMISGMSRTRVKVTDALRQDIVAAYIGDGQPSIREVAAKVKCSYGTAHRVLSEAELTRPRGATKAARARKAATA